MQKLEMSPELEVFYDLVCNLAADWATDMFRPNMFELEDSRARLALCLDWANDFIEVNKDRGWVDGIYFETVDGFYTSKVKDWYAPPVGEA